MLYRIIAHKASGYAETLFYYGLSANAIDEGQYGTIYKVAGSH